MHYAAGRRRRNVSSAGSPLGEGVTTGGSRADSEFDGDLLVGVPSIALAFCPLLLALCKPEDEEDREEEDDRDPGENASHE
jgi:hypothetical protein